LGGERSRPATKLTTCAKKVSEGKHQVMQTKLANPENRRPQAAAGAVLESRAHVTRQHRGAYKKVFNGIVVRAHLPFVPAATPAGRSGWLGHRSIHLSRMMRVEDVGQAEGRPVMRSHVRVSQCIALRHGPLPSATLLRVATGRGCRARLATDKNHIRVIALARFARRRSRRAFSRLASWAVESWTEGWRSRRRLVVMVPAAVSRHTPWVAPHRRALAVAAEKLTGVEVLLIKLSPLRVHSDDCLSSKLPAR